MLQTVREHVSESAARNIEEWLTKPKFAEYKSELEAMISAERWSDLEDSFFKVIEFGTAGRRGTTGVGSNRINRITIGESAQALCLYLNQHDEAAAQKGIVIAYDTRLSSPELSRYVAQVCAANGFKTYLFESFRSTPELSFAVRHLEAAAGIVVTASHNPPADNGFKAYWSDGAQIAAPHDTGILEIADSITEIIDTDYDAAITSGDIELIGKEVDDAYIEAGANEAVGTARDVSIVYSPLHGAGQTNVLPILALAGFNQVSPVMSQMVPDGSFPTIPTGKPNPQELKANELAVEQMLRESADIAITNDPDADRFGIMIRQDRSVHYLTGNQAAVVGADYVLSAMKEAGILTADHYLVKTIVTSDMLTAIAKAYGASIYDNLLVGFKYVGELILKNESTDKKFVMGAEESYGFLKGDYARDKDGASGALVLAEAAAHFKQQGKTLYDRLHEMYTEHGLYLELLADTYFEGASGFATMQKAMADIRSEVPREVGGRSVTAVLDYKTLLRTNLADGSTTPIDSINGNVVALEFEGDSRRRITIRPSGTEPKLKIYAQWHEDAEADTRSQYARLNEDMRELAQTFERYLLG